MSSSFPCPSQMIIKIAAGNGVGKILVGKHSVYTSCFSCYPKEEGKHIFSYDYSGKCLHNCCPFFAKVSRCPAYGGFIMSASHNPGGPEYDWGIKFNYNSGQPAPESITDKIYGNTLSISEIRMADIPDVDLSRLGVTNYGKFSVEVVDPVSDYLELLENVFDFELIRSLISRPDFRTQLQMDSILKHFCG